MKGCVESTHSSLHSAAAGTPRGVPTPRDPIKLSTQHCYHLSRNNMATACLSAPHTTLNLRVLPYVEATRIDLILVGSEMENRSSSRQMNSPPCLLTEIAF